VEGGQKEEMIRITVLSIFEITCLITTVLQNRNQSRIGRLRRFRRVNNDGTLRAVNRENIGENYESRIKLQFCNTLALSSNPLCSPRVRIARPYRLIHLRLLITKLVLRFVAMTKRVRRVGHAIRRRRPNRRPAAKVSWTLLVAGVALLLAPVRLSAQTKGILGDWTEPTGSVIRIGRCGAQVCMWIVSVSKRAPAATDVHNPHPALRSRSLCGLEIGSGFKLRDADHATGGTLYDPKTGKTYHGMITADGATLRLRGYIGIPLFGRSQTWRRPTQPVKACGTGPEN
jgi:uncharacterized protein (DUF2147 family)